MSPAFTLRVAVGDDIEALRTIEKAARSRYWALQELAFVAEAAPIAPERFATGTTVVAERRGKCVGFALAQPMDGLLYLVNISVAPEANRSGIGTALLRETEAAARARRHAAVTLAAFKSPPWNGPWFRKHGYMPMPESEIGWELQAVLERHASVLDMAGRETLWRRLIAVQPRPMIGTS